MYADGQDPWDRCVCGLRLTLNGTFIAGLFMGYPWESKSVISGGACPYGLDCNDYNINSRPISDPTLINANVTDATLVATIVNIGYYTAYFNFPPSDQTPFDAKTNAVLIHKYGTEAYPNASYQKEDGRIRIAGYMTGGTNIANRAVQLRVIDPQDKSAYITPNPNYDPAAGDNKAKAKLAKINSDGTTDESSAVEYPNALALTTGSLGEFQAMLLSSRHTECLPTNMQCRRRCN
jgi:hypothetical protein